MSTVHEVFEIPLKKSGVIAKDEAEKIFMNWHDILQCNRNFLAGLYDWTSSGSDILGPVISKHVSDRKFFVSVCKASQTR